MSEQMTPDGPSEFGRWLFETRTKKNLTVNQLAETSGISFVQIYNIESGRSQNPQGKTRTRLANALGESPSPAVVQATESAATAQNVGEFIDFDPHDENDLPEVAGVYVFYDVSERPIYVGQTKSIRERILRDHFTRFWFKAPIVQTAAFVEIEDETLRKKVETVLIRFLKTNAVLNKQHVDRGTETTG